MEDLVLTPNEYRWGQQPQDHRGGRRPTAFTDMLRT